ncbi:hypothetical protein GBO93_07260 [Pediococcus acidilactici]|uniref:hypothetical protein n=1 Tax=Pediococcus acidilactici TaxID=1254 RepID=UPI0013225CF8|nr:hypothetical protein [Pediococcus acidilactici]KAF0343799.1 hypothetical protein GBO43_08320 [Pediococcus acidilactici]KAF0353618.1 hypothetical protein GBO47_08375 [Pediococcus acidilactici]KAF0357954.1 hypothetical protein GBO51_08355 [Pediococcus acidilactici]KAF0362116.1 hypothetical protein GBO53_08305 [Pediococcus acidilactici]KAF0408641.1 hypothetical protein GBO74_08570 [Pediococcus acidilactici]
MSTKIIQLRARGDNDFGLSKGEPYYPKVGADSVTGLGSEIDKRVPKYNLATPTADGLISKEDKAKLDKLQVEPFEGLKFKSPDGSIFVLSVDNDGKPVFAKETKVDDNK